MVPHTSPAATDASAPTSRGARTLGVYEQLRRAIVEGAIRPNERLIEIELAEQLDVSRTPIRESLQRLAADGLIESRPRGGWVVREHSPDEIREIFEVRAALEGFAAGLAAKRATDEMLRRVVAIHEQYIATIDNVPRGHLVEHNDEFHDAVIAAAANSRLAAQIASNRQYYFVHRIAGFLSDEEVRSSISGHEKLVDALLAREPDRAERVARDAVLEGLDKTLAKLR